MRWYICMNYQQQELRQRRRADRQARKIEAARSYLSAAGLDQAWDIYQGTATGYEENTIRDIVAKLVRYGSISEKQTNFVSALVQKIGKRAETEAARAAESEAAAPCPSGRTWVKGEVLTTKRGEGPYGPTHKMLVKDETGFKVWCSVPRDLSVDRGDVIRFQVNLTPSNDDPKFGFGSRPAKAENLTQQQLEHFIAERENQPCHHGNKPEDCNACMIESDLAYDAARGN